MKAIQRTTKIQMPNLSCSIMDAEIDQRIYDECVRRYDNARKEAITEMFEQVAQDNFDIIDCEFAIAAIEIGYAKGTKRIEKLLDAQHSVEERITKRFESEIVFGAEKGTDEWHRRDDMLTVMKQELLSYGFDYDEYRKRREENKNVAE